MRLFLLTFSFFCLFSFTELNDNLLSITDSGAIKSLDAREDGVYITYMPSIGADPVTKKLGSNGTIKCFVADVISGYQETYYPFTFDLSSVYENYRSITAANIVGGIYSVSTVTTEALTRSGSGRFGEITSYDPETGIINATIRITSQRGNVTVSVTPCFYIVD